MAEMRKPEWGAKRPQSGPPGRAPAQKKTPPYLMIALIGAPLLGIVVLATVPKNKEEVVVRKKETVAKKAINVKDLQDQVPKLKAALREVQRLSQSEDPSAKVKAEALKHDLEKWMDAWDAVFEPQRDEEGKLPEELRGYQSIRSQVNQIQDDLLKSTGFF